MRVLPALLPIIKRENTVVRHKLKRLLPVGLLFLSGGLVLHNWTHGPYFSFAAGMLIGMSVVVVVAGLIAGRSSVLR